MLGFLSAARAGETAPKSAAPAVSSDKPQGSRFFFVFMFLFLVCVLCPWRGLVESATDKLVLGIWTGGNRGNGDFPFPSLFSLFATVKSGFSFRKQERHGEAQAPVWSAAGSVGVILEAEREADGLLANLAQLAHAHVQRHGPLMIFPIVSGLGVDAETCKLFRGVSQERLEERGAHVGATAFAGVR